MAGKRVLGDYFRDVSGNGITSGDIVIKKLSDNSTIYSGSTVSDTEPLTPLPGFFQLDETGLGYPGPIMYLASDPVTGAVRNHTSKSTGVVGPIRTADISRMWQVGGEGVIPGAGSELAVATSGSSMVLTVAAGQYVAPMAGDALFYSWPSSRNVTVTTADTQGRIDAVVLRFYPPGVVQEGRVDLVVLKGTPSGTPAAPAPTQNIGTVWEVVLATVLVDASVSVIANGKVTDARKFAGIYPAGVVAGDILYVAASGKLARLPKSTDGLPLTLASGLPAWGTIPVASITGLGTMAIQNASAVVITGGTAAGLTLTAPTIADFTNAAHDHGDADDGGGLVAAALPVMVGDSGAGGTKGAVPAPAIGDATKFLRGDATFATVPTGDASTNTSSSVDSEVVLFSSTTGKVLKRATGSGIAKLASGVLSVVAAPSGTIVGTSDAQTLTNKTITSPSGLVKGDVGLGNVDNTSDATKNAAAVTLASKTLTTPTIASFINAHHDHNSSAGGNNVLAASVDVSAITTGQFLKAVSGAIAGGAFTTPHVDVAYRSSSSGNVTSTTGADVGSLTCSVTLTTGWTWDLFFFGHINANAPSGDFIYAGANVDGDIFGFSDTGTVGGERALAFGGYKLGVAGNGAAHTAAARMKVGSGTGTANAGAAILIAIPRPS